MLCAHVLDHFTRGHQVNNGVYKAGFATSQAAHDAAAAALYDALARLERRLEGRRFLHGDRCGAVINLIMT